MKLYEFTFSDNTNLSEPQILDLAMESLKEEAVLQGWAAGYNLRQCQNSKQISDGSTEYYFEVDGEYLADGQSGEGQDSNKSSQNRSGVAASP